MSAPTAPMGGRTDQARFDPCRFASRFELGFSGITLDIEGLAGVPLDNEG